MNILNENTEARNEHNQKTAKALNNLANEYNSNTIEHGDTPDPEAKAIAKAASTSATIRLAAAFDLNNQAGA